ncbi:MIZ zinc finger family protein [Trichomonas vaginalis G3]|uniref:MIZ zinc finger family protein n=1 Tax=Trichomonas vaginalis (strain ATCC PRA-98 / G3) TaxID=412133 RepID=A2FJP2_TRIV3|nr:SUMO transferase protein [Trichomonas vaginalis G3]EAX94874.1 MIZ zinc finger family protein [Trichomonas vaginalis G3]KAI5541502.1 SUMO transferase protein [Trichomonas vaginalis G3]|eukprot:XP_001307804.1 MIZ zinc finger family protein [Trichomonas vaginalis G3]
MKANSEHVVGQTPTAPPPTVAAIPHHPAVLSNEEFENLKRSIQLLRIEQIRYIVQKYNLPANGNKTKLLHLILTIIETLRATPLLVQISAEVSRLLAQQHEPFANPLETTHKIEKYKIQGPVITPSNPFYQIIDGQPRLGPLIASAGTSTLSAHQIKIPEDVNILLEFSWLNAPPVPFDLVMEVNGNQVIVSADDPKPGALDLTSYIGPTRTLLFAIDSIKTPVPVIMAIRDFKLVTIKEIAEKLAVEQKINAPAQNLNAKGKGCSHAQTFPLVNFLSSFYSTGKFKCPVCNQNVELEGIQISSSNKA